MSIVRGLDAGSVRQQQRRLVAIGDWRAHGREHGAAPDISTRQARPIHACVRPRCPCTSAADEGTVAPDRPPIPSLSRKGDSDLLWEVPLLTCGRSLERAANRAVRGF